MLVCVGRLTGQRAAGRDVLAISDTSELNFAGHAGRKQGFGKVGNGRDIGLFVHPVIALDAPQGDAPQGDATEGDAPEGDAPEGGVLGLVDAEMIHRPTGPVAHRRSRNAEEKESRRWLRGMESAGPTLAAASRITMVEDREGDIYDQFARRPEAVHLLVHAARDRSVGPGLKLFATAAGWAELSRPASAARCLPARLRLRVVDVREVDAPPAGQQAVPWCLLTTHAVETPADARRMVAWYRRR